MGGWLSRSGRATPTPDTGSSGPRTRETPGTCPTSRGGLPLLRDPPEQEGAGRAGPAAALRGARAPPARAGRRGPGLLERAAGTDATVELAASRPDARSGNASVPGRRWVHPLRG